MYGPSFAETALKEAGHDHVKTLRGSLDTSVFKRLPEDFRQENRAKQNISEDDYIIGFVFRNQLRKSVPNLIDGFELFLRQHPECQAKLLLHTHWSEGWDIPRLITEKGLDPSKVLTTYLCHRCNRYEIKPFTGQQQNCSLCGGEKCQLTTNVGRGVSEEQLNEIYNLMDVYCHPFTSGGQEIPVQEAKLTELVTLVTNYSCGEDSCSSESGGLPLEWAEYREPGTQFIKASTSPSSIRKQLSKVYKMNAQKKRSLERKSRKWVIDNFSIPVIGKRVEDIIEKMPAIDWDFDFSEPLRNPDYEPPHLEDDGEWIIDIYKNILHMDVDENDEGYKHWIQTLGGGEGRPKILDFFHQTAKNENQAIETDHSKKTLQELIDDEEDKRLIVVMPGTIGDIYMVTSLLPSLKEVYPEHAIYFSTQPQYFDVLNGNPYIYKTIPYNEQFNDLLYLEGRGDHKGFFDIAFLPTIGTQQVFNYQHNAADRIQFDLCTS